MYSKIACPRVTNELVNLLVVSRPIYRWRFLNVKANPAVRKKVGFQFFSEARIGKSGRIRSNFLYRISSRSY